MQDTRPVLAKGDNFRPPYESKERMRYIKEYLTGARRRKAAAGPACSSSGR